MNFCLASLYRPNYRPLAELTIDRNKIPYCERHGYSWCLMTDGFSNNLGFDKIRHMLWIMTEHAEFDWVFWCDCDTLITNFHIRLEELVNTDRHVIVAPDWCAQVQAGVFLVRCSPEGKAFLSDVLDQESRLKNHGWAENQAMIDLLQKHRAIIERVPQRKINAYDYARHFREKYPLQPKVMEGVDFYGQDGQWKLGDFMIHWPSLSMETRISEAKRLLPMVRGNRSNPDLIEYIKQLAGPLRAETFAAAAEFILRHDPGCIVETGCYRGSDCDGNSTLILALLAMEIGPDCQCYSVDISVEHIASAKKRLAEVGIASDTVTFVESDSVAWLRKFNTQIGFAYLDSFDHDPNNPLPCQQHQLAEVTNCLPMMTTPAAFLLDDNVAETGGKTKLACAHLESLGWKKAAEGYQVLFTK